MNMSETSREFFSIAVEAGVIYTLLTISTFTYTSFLRKGSRGGFQHVCT